MSRSASRRSTQSSQPLPKLTVETSKQLANTYTLKYEIVPASDSVTAAWIEVWDRPKLLLRKSVLVASGSMEWNDTSERTPENLRVALLDPDAPKWPCIDNNCMPEDLKQVGPSSELVVGVGPDGNQPVPDLQIQVVRVFAGSPGQEVELAGTYFTPGSRVVAAEMTTPEHYRDLQFATVTYVDMHHLKAWIPADLLLSPRVLPLVVLPAQEDMNMAEPVFDGKHSSVSLYDASIVVVCKESPQLDRLEPAELPADAADHKIPNTEQVDQDQVSDDDRENRQSVVVRLLGSGFTRKSRVVLAPDPLYENKITSTFLSPQELRIRLSSSRLKSSVGWPLPFWVINDEEGCGISESRTFHVLPTDEFPLPGKEGLISITDPYPVPLMEQDSPEEMQLTIKGENFRPNDTVVASVRGNGDSEYKNLKTTFIASDELRAWLPREMWRVHRLSFRFVIRTVDGEQAIEAGAPE